MRCLLPPDAPRHWCDIRRRTVQVANPAAGTDWSVQVPVAEAWQIDGMRATFTTDANVANREVQLVVSLAGIQRAVYKASRIQVASRGADYGIVPGGPAPIDSTSATAAFGVPAPFIFEPGSTLAVSTILIQVGDAWTNIALDVWFELNRGEGAARRYLERRRAEEAALPDVQLRGV